MAEADKKDFLEELKAMKERMEDLFVRNFNLGPGTDKKEYTPQRSADWVPVADIVDTGNQLLYLIDLPGVLEENIEVECKADRLLVSGLRPEDLPPGEPQLKERSRGEFSRIFKFPCAVEEEGIVAELKKGVLRVTVPKSSPENRTQKVFVREVD
ncbi:MAG: Hsp20/alpha crystallin family protein [Syntrophobacteraceae bacterium]